MTRSASRLGTTRTVAYGSDPSQVADLHLPDASRPPVVCLLHGGFWRMPYGRGQMSAVAADLASRGHAVWNIGYRRVGASGGGWPGTLLDVAEAVDHLATLDRDDVALDLTRVTMVGHSAGGHLALWVAGRHRSGLAPTPCVPAAQVVALAPIADLADAYRQHAGGGAVAEFLGGAPETVPDRCRSASPIAMLPLGVPQTIVHGTLDDAVPIALSRDYVDAARAAGDTVELVELDGSGHMEFLDPASAAHAILVHRLSR